MMMICHTSLRTEHQSLWRRILCSQSLQQNDDGTETITVSPGGPAPLTPKISSKSCSFQAILRGKPPFRANFGLRALLGSKLCLTKNLDPRLCPKLRTSMVLVLVLDCFSVHILTSVFCARFFFFVICEEKSESGCELVADRTKRTMRKHWKCGGHFSLLGLKIPNDTEMGIASWMPGSFWKTSFHFHKRSQITWCCG